MYIYIYIYGHVFLPIFPASALIPFRAIFGTPALREHVPSDGFATATVAKLSRALPKDDREHVNTPTHQ